MLAHGLWGVPQRRLQHYDNGHGDGPCRSCRSGFGSITTAQNGFSTTPRRGLGALAINTAGNREETVNYLVNGITLNNLVFSSIEFQPSISTVQEFRLDNSTMSAEYGQSKGAVVNVATRSGTSQFHGELSAPLAPRSWPRGFMILGGSNKVESCPEAGHQDPTDAGEHIEIDDLDGGGHCSSQIPEQVGAVAHDYLDLGLHADGRLWQVGRHRGAA